MRKGSENQSTTGGGGKQAVTSSLQNTPQTLVFELDTEARLIHLNHAIQVFSGYGLEEVQGLDWCKTFVPGRDRKRIRKFIKLAIKDRHYHPYANINHIVIKDGSERLIEWYGKTLKNETGDITGLLIIAQDITEMKQAGEKTFEILKQNRDMTRCMFETQERERQYLAQQLHDEFGQWLTAIQLNIQSITNRIGAHSPEVDASIETITHSAYQIHKGIRNLIQTLRPVLLDQLGLVDSLQELFDLWRQKYPHMHCRLYLEGALDNLKENLNITIYRLIQDGLAVATTHINTSHIVVQLNRHYNTGTGEDILMLTIDYHGIAIPVDSLDYDLGLLGMRERTLAAGGIFSIDHQQENEILIKAQLFINHDSNSLQ